MTDSGKAITMRSGAASGPPEMTTEPIATSAESYGRLKEGAHFAGYSFERACTHLEWLLEADRWTFGGRHDDVNKFLESIKLATNFVPLPSSASASPSASRRCSQRRRSAPSQR